MSDPLTEQTGLTAEQRSQRGSIGAYSLWAQIEDPSAHTAPAREAFLSRFEKQVDPQGVLAPEERARRAESARRAYFQRLALASSKARSRKAASRRKGGGARDAA
jgi:hypothetical protein